MTLTTYGYKLPSDGDLAKGANGWFAQLVFDINRLDGHNHDGLNSPSIPLSSFAPYSSTITVGATAGVCTAWVADGAGYVKTVTVPVAITEVNDYNVKFIATAPGGIIGQTMYLGYKRTAATTYEIYCNDNTVALTALYR